MLDQVNQQFRQLYNQLDKDHLHLLSDLYTMDTRFIDPFHQVEGLKSLQKYCADLYANVTEIQFDYGDVSYGDQLFHQDWVMTYHHPRINRGQAVKVPGCSRVRINEAGKITEHQDYFDAGQMLYRQLPVLGSVINLIIRRLEP